MPVGDDGDGGNSGGRAAESYIHTRTRRSRMTLAVRVSLSLSLSLSLSRSFLSMCSTLLFFHSRRVLCRSRPHCQPEESARELCHRRHPVTRVLIQGACAWPRERARL